MSKPRLIQVLCGPQRHCIFGVAYQDQDKAEMGEAAVAQVNRFLHAGVLNPWCGICGTKREQWIFEDRQLRFETLQEAAPALKKLEEEQARVAAHVKHSRG